MNKYVDHSQILIDFTLIGHSIVTNDVLRFFVQTLKTCKGSGY